MICGCGNKTKNKNGICSSCSEKMKLLRQIRRMVGVSKKDQKVVAVKKNPKKEYHQTLCWRCENACGKCNWSKNFTPVDGWNAIPTKTFVGRTAIDGKAKRIYTDSFDVYDCPEFKTLEWLRSYGIDKR